MDRTNRLSHPSHQTCASRSPALLCFFLRLALDPPEGRLKFRGGGLNAKRYFLQWNTISISKSLEICVLPYASHLCYWYVWVDSNNKRIRRCKRWKKCVLYSAMDYCLWATVSSDSSVTQIGFLVVKHLNDVFCNKLFHLCYSWVWLSINTRKPKVRASHSLE